jgi:hypothetical protein
MNGYIVFLPLSGIYFRLSREATRSPGRARGSTLSSRIYSKVWFNTPEALLRGGSFEKKYNANQAENKAFLKGSMKYHVSLGNISAENIKAL